LHNRLDVPDQEQAIRKAIEIIGVKDPLQQSRLSAINAKEIQA